MAELTQPGAWHSFCERYDVIESFKRSFLLDCIGDIAIAINIARKCYMKRSAARVGFEYQVCAETVISFQGRRYRVGVHGISAMQLVIDMANASGGELSEPRALLAFRRRVREVMAAPPRAVLAYFAAQTNDPACRRLAIWLRGRCRGTLGTLMFWRLWADAELSLRRELTRAFKRMDAWHYLRRIEEDDPDPRIRQMARQPVPRSFDSRLLRFLNCVHPTETPKGETTLFIHHEVDLDSGRPAKPRWLIRRLLEHIRALVRGQL
jgi:hypothetical protein